MSSEAPAPSLRPQWPRKRYIPKKLDKDGKCTQLFADLNYDADVSSYTVTPLHSPLPRLPQTSGSSHESHSHRKCEKHGRPTHYHDHRYNDCKDTLEEWCMRIRERRADVNYLLSLPRLDDSKIYPLAAEMYAEIQRLEWNIRRCKFLADHCREDSQNSGSILKDVAEKGIYNDLLREYVDYIIKLFPEHKRGMMPVDLLGLVVKYENLGSSDTVPLEHEHPNIGGDYKDDGGKKSSVSSSSHEAGVGSKGSEPEMNPVEIARAPDFAHDSPDIRTAPSVYLGQCSISPDDSISMASIRSHQDPVKGRQADSGGSKSPRSRAPKTKTPPPGSDNTSILLPRLAAGFPLPPSASSWTPTPPESRDYAPLIPLPASFSPKYQSTTGSARSDTPASAHTPVVLSPQRPPEAASTPKSPQSRTAKTPTPSTTSENTSVLLPRLAAGFPLPPSASSWTPTPPDSREYAPLIPLPASRSPTYQSTKTSVRSVPSASPHTPGVSSPQRPAEVASTPNSGATAPHRVPLPSSPESGVSSAPYRIPLPSSSTPTPPRVVFSPPRGTRTPRPLILRSRRVSPCSCRDDSPKDTKTPENPPRQRRKKSPVPERKPVAAGNKDLQRKLEALQKERDKLSAPADKKTKKKKKNSKGKRREHCNKCGGSWDEQIIFFCNFRKPKDSKCVVV